MNFITLLFLLFLFLPSPAHATTPTATPAVTQTPTATPTLTPTATPTMTPTPKPEISISAPESAKIGESFILTFDIQAFDSNTQYYTKARLGQEENALNKGQTYNQNSDTWLSDTSPWLDFPTISTDQAGNFSGTLQARVKNEESVGEYHLSLRLRSLSTEKNQDSDLLQISINPADPTPTEPEPEPATPTETPVDTPTPTDTPAPTSTPTPPASPTPTITKTPTPTQSPTPIPTVEEEYPTPDPSDLVLGSSQENSSLDEESPPKEKRPLVDYLPYGIIFAGFSLLFAGTGLPKIINRFSKKDKSYTIKQDEEN